MKPSPVPAETASLSLGLRRYLYFTAAITGGYVYRGSQIASLQGLLSNLLSSPRDQQDAAAVKGLREQIDKLRDERARMREPVTHGCKKRMRSQP